MRKKDVKAPNTRAEFVKIIAEKSGIENQIVDLVITEFLKELTSAVAHGAYVQLRPFFSMYAVLRKAKKARNITKNVSFDIPAHYKPVMRPSKEFATLTNNLMEGGEE